VRRRLCFAFAESSDRTHRLASHTEHGILNALKEESAIAEAEVAALGTAMIEAVCKCSEEYDEAVQLQVIKTLLVAVTSLQFEIHDANLLLAVRACFQIHLTSKNPVIKTTAKAALTQMISIVFQRMESYDVVRPAAGEEGNRYVPGPLVSGAAAAGCDADSDVDRALCSSPTPDGSAPLSAEPASAVETTAKAAESFDSPYQKDAYLLFRALCKLSTKGFQDESTNSTDAVIHQNKCVAPRPRLSSACGARPVARRVSDRCLCVSVCVCVRLCLCASAGCCRWS
jgi:hypothetical protein